MGDITTIGLDLAKSVFQVHAVDEAGNVVMRTSEVIRVPDKNCKTLRRVMSGAAGTDAF